MQPNNYQIGSIVVFIILFIFWSTMLGIFKKKPAYFQKFVADSITYKNTTLNMLFPKSKAGWVVLVISIVFVITGLVLVLYGLNESPLKNSSGINRDPITVTNVESFGNNNSTSTYTPIGYGPVLDKLKVKNWINGNTPDVGGLTVSSGQTAWVDGNGIPISIPTEQFKALYGFIPPSFVYYPKGQSNKDYNGTNYESGREDCMKACTLSNCSAVQTEVPENCSQKSGPTGTGNSCGTNSEFACTLFYDNIRNADDAYWTISKFNPISSPGCFEATGSSCLGKKYYEDSLVPIDLPNMSLKPSESSIKFCDSSITNSNNCVHRPLLTTEYVQTNHPYYLLPINVSKVAGAVNGNYSMVVPTTTFKNGFGTNCGVVNGKLRSCTGQNTCSQGESNLSNSDCWQVSTDTCTGTPFDLSSGASQLQNYKNNYAQASPKPGSNYDDLYSSCYYRQQLTVVQPIQFNCDSSTVTRGCWGSSSILYTENLSDPSNMVACSDTSIIPNSERCQNEGGSLAACTGFPYSCGSNNGTSTLWVKQ
jgi:hypothetical protein